MITAGESAVPDDATKVWRYMSFSRFVWLLGHADYRTTQRAYNLGRALDTARHHQEVIRSIREESGAESRRKLRR